MNERISYSYTPPGEKRKHYLCPDDIEILLGRLPNEVFERLRTVHFNDRALGRRRLGYVNRGHREIAICALPPNVSLSSFFVRRSGRRRVHGSPENFGAKRGMQWPETAVRRFLLYEVFLHELGHLQIVDSTAPRIWRQFASETIAQEFANDWRKRLWSKPFDHPDPIHNPATEEELAQIEIHG